MFTFASFVLGNPLASIGMAFGGGTAASVSALSLLLAVGGLAALTGMGGLVMGSLFF